MRIVDGVVWEESPRVVTRLGPDGSQEEMRVWRGRLVGASSFDPEAHTLVRCIPLR